MTVGSGSRQVSERGQMRASHADRDSAVGLLKKAFVEGRLTKDEYDVRVGRALTARTYSDLDAVVADLPVPPAPVPRNVQPLPARTNPLAIASLLFGAGEFFTAGLTAIPAVLFGHMARRQIRQTGERGSALALAGLVLGWAALLLGLLLAVGIVAGALAGAAHAPAMHAQFFGPPGPGSG